MTSVPWVFTNTSWATWEHIAEEQVCLDSLLGWAHVYPDKCLMRRHQHQVVATWTWSILLEVTKGSLENRFSCMNKPFWEWQEQCIEFTCYPGVLQHPTQLVLQPEPVLVLEHLHCPFPFCIPCGHRVTIKPAVPKRWHCRLPQSLR